MLIQRILLTACASLALGLPGSASLLFSNADPPLSTTNRNNSIEGVAAYLQIGPANVAIDQIGINAQPFASGQLKFVIFSDSAAPGGNSGSLLLSDTVNVAAANAPSYILSDPISFTLQAGQYYDIGAIYSGTDISYTYDFTTDSENGISSLAGAQNINNFANPVEVGHGGVSDISIQLYSAATAVPEPGLLPLVGVGLLAVGLGAAGRNGRAKSKRTAA